MKKSILLLFLSVLSVSCISTKSTLKNVDNTALKPQVVDNHFIITEYSPDSKYGYHKDYPINIGFDKESIGPKNIALFFNALKGNNGENFTYEKIESCCPFPTNRIAIGAGTLDIYEITFQDRNKKIKLYFNIYDKGKILCPKGFIIK